MNRIVVIIFAMLLMLPWGARGNDCTFTPSLNGPNSVCEGSFSQVYTTDGGGLGYTWSISAGGFISSGSATNSVLVTWTTAGAQWISVDFTSAAGCTAVTPTVLNVTVNSNPQVSVSITPSSNPVCAGTMVTFTATAQNPGPGPHYQWLVNGINVGSDSPLFSYIPVNSDQVKCILTSNAVCSTGNPATSNTVFMAVSNNLPVSVSVSASPPGPVCDGDQVTFTATPVNGGPSPTYQWKVNGINAGINNYRYTYTPLNGDIVTCVVTSNTPCSSGNPATSVPIVMTVNSSMPVSVSITATANPVCEGTLVTYTATPVNGGSSPTFQWVVNGIGAGGNSPAFTYIPINGDQVSCFLLSSLSGCATNNPAQSNVIPMTVYPILPASVTIDVSANPICAGTTVTFTAYPVYGGSTPSYQWKVNGINSGPNSQTFNYAPANGQVITCVMTSSEPCPTGSPATSNAIPMTVYQVLAVSVSISASSNPVCSGSPVTFTATPVNGGSLPIFEWYLNGSVAGGLGSTYTYIPSAGDEVSCRLTSYLNCTTGNPAYSNVITMSLDPELPVSLSITTSQNPFCQGAPATFSAISVNGGSTPLYQWQVNGVNAGSNNPLFSYIPSNGDGVICILTSNANCASGSPATSNTLVMIMNPVPPVPVSVFIAATSNPVCTGSTVTFNATPVNGGSSPSYQWKVNGVNTGTNSSVISYLPSDNDLVTCILTSSEGCTSGNPATSNPVTMTVSPFLPVSVIIAASQNPVCQGTSVTFTATAQNPGPGPQYQWKVNGINAGTNSSAFSYLPSDNDLVTCILTSNTTCSTGNPATSNTLTMTVNSTPVSVSITANQNPVCQGTLVTFTATAQNPGPSPQYQWQVNGVNTGTNSSVFSYTPSNNDLVSCILHPASDCPVPNPAISNNIFMTVDPLLPVSVSISTPLTTVCQGATITFNSTAVNGGATPVYQWQVNGVNTGTNSSVFSYLPSDNDLVTCILTSSYSCPTGNPATSNIIQINTVPSMPVSVSITASANPVCSGTPVTFTATAQNPGPGPLFQWQVNGVNAGTNSSVFSYLPSDNDLVSCILTSNHSCATGNPATSNIINMTVNPYLPVIVTITASANPVCSGTAVTFNAAPVNGGSSPAYQWQVNGINSGTNSSAFSYLPSNNDLVSCILTSSYDCPSWNPATSNIIAMTVNPTEPLSITISPSANPVCSGTTVTFTATAQNPGPAPVYQWQVNGVNAGTNSSVFSYLPSDIDLISCILYPASLCPVPATATSNIITMSVLPYLPVSVSITASANPVCAGITVTFTATAQNPGPSPQYQWQVNGVNAGTNSSVFSYQPSDIDLITCILHPASLCPLPPTPTSNIITMSVTPLLPVSVIITPSSNPVCTGTSVTFTATAQNPGPSPVYQWKVNGINAGTNSSAFSYTPFNNDLVSCILYPSSLCPVPLTATSNTITMQVSPSLVVAISIDADHNPCCTGSLVTFTATPTNGGAAPGYQWKVNGINAGTNSSVFSHAPVNGDNVSCILTSSYLCPTTNPVTSNTITMNVVSNLGVSVSIAASDNPVCAGTAVTFTATGNNQGYFPGWQWQVNGLNTGPDSPFFTYAPVNGDVVVCILNSSESCTLGNPAASDPITMTVTPISNVSITISTPSASICSGSTVTFTASPVNPGPGPLYQWQVNGINAGTNSSTFSYLPSNNDLVSCILIPNSQCPIPLTAVSNTITLTVGTTLPVSVNISASVNTICSGTTVTFTAAAQNPGAGPHYQWKVNGSNVGTNSPIYSYPPSNNDLVSCILTSYLACATGNPATSNIISMIVNAMLPVSVSITASANPVCAGTSVNFTATPQNPGSGPQYQWQVNGVNAGTNSSVFTYPPSDNDLVSCILTSNYPCPTGNPATSNVVQISAVPNLPVSVSITASANPICSGSSVTFTAAPQNPGPGPQYQWKVNGLNAGTNSSVFSYLPSNNDLVSCILTSNYSCPTGNPATSNVIQISAVPSLPVSVSISVSANPVCLGTSVTFTAIGQNPGPGPQYQWQVNGINAGTNSSVFSYLPSDNDLVSCILTSDLFCAAANPATSNVIQETVTPNLPVSVTITASANPVCAGATVNFTAAAQNPGPGPQYQWQVNGVNAGTNSSTFSYPPSDNDLVSCILYPASLCPFPNPATSNVITMSMTPLLPVSVSINTSANPVCTGTSVTFTATPQNPGGSPQYQWKINGINAGTNSSLISYLPSDNDLVSCILTSSLLCNSGNPATSNVIQETVSPLLPVSITITASNNPSCPASMVTFIATTQNPGPGPQYQWQVNGVNAGTNSSVFSYLPSVGDLVTCILYPASQCPFPNPATSNTIVVSNTAPEPVSVSIAASVNPVCSGSPVTFSATPVYGGSAPIYQWKVNGISTGTNSDLFTYSPANNDQVSCVMTSSYGCPTNNPATSNTLYMAVSTNLPVSVTVSASPPSPVCEATQVTFTATPVNGGSGPSYQWEVNGISAGTNNYRYTYTPLDGDIITCVLTSNTPCPSGNPATSSPIPMTVSPNIPVSIAITATATTVCAGTAVTFNATAVNEGLTPLYQWVVNGTGVGTNVPVFTYYPSNGDQVSCYLLSSIANCAVNNPAASNVIPMTVNYIAPVSVSIGASANPVCLGNTVTYTAYPLYPGASPHYQWYVNGLATGPDAQVFSYSPADADVVSCVLNSSEPCPTANPVTSNSIPMTVYEVMAVSVSITASSNPVCAGSPVTFSATPENGGSLPIYEWYVNGVVIGGMGSTYSYIPVNGDQVRCRLTSYLFCTSGNPAYSGTITMILDPELPVSLSLTVSMNPFCTGIPVDFTAVPVNGGSTPSYEWQVNGSIAGTSSPTFSYTPSNGDAVTCILTSNANCAIGNPAVSNTLVMLLNPDPPLPVSVSITVSVNPVCTTNPVIFTAIPINGGSAPIYQWQVNGINAGPNNPVYSYVPLDGDQVQCILNSSSGCAIGNPSSSNTITISKNPLLPVNLTLCNPITTHDALPFALSRGLPLGGVWSGTGVSGNIFDPSSVPPAQNQVTITYTYVNMISCTGTASQVITLYPPGGGFVCGQTLTDVRDNKTYATRLIGTQCWQARNLDFGTFIPSSGYQTNNCVAEKYCYDDNPANCGLKGGLYQWDEMMQYQIIPGSQGLCPPVWHVATEAEWSLLESNLFGAGNAGDSLKTGGSSGFNALLAGVFYSKTIWKFPAFATLFWTSTPTTAFSAMSHGLNQPNKSVSNYPALQSNAFSVRCVKD